MTWKLDCGDYALFVIEDGYYWRDPNGYHPEATEHDWRFHLRNDQGLVRFNFGCFVVTDGDRTMMIDSGLGDISREGMVTGLMPEAVDALGIPRDSVETVVYTHMHYDHIGGSVRRGQVIFPRARHVFHEKEWAYWQALDDEFGSAAQRIMRPLLDSGAVEFIDRDTEVLPGVTALEAFGHTPGHLAVNVDSGGTRTLVGGDISNHPFQVENPHWSLPVDCEPELAARTRDSVFEEIRDTPTTFLAGHYPLPGVGRIITDDGTRVFQPATVARVG